MYARPAVSQRVSTYVRTPCNRITHICSGNECLQFERAWAPLATPPPRPALPTHLRYTIRKIRENSRVCGITNDAVVSHSTVPTVPAALSPSWYTDQLCILTRGRGAFHSRHSSSQSLSSSLALSPSVSLLHPQTLHHSLLLASTKTQRTIRESGNPRIQESQTRDLS